MKKIKEPKAMEEIHEIRKKLYEESKNLTAQQRIIRSRKNALKLIKDHNLNLKVHEKTGK